jgi:hypothetical protein
VASGKNVYSLALGRDPVSVMTRYEEVTRGAVQQRTGQLAVCDLAGTVVVFDRAGQRLQAWHLHWGETGCSVLKCRTNLSNPLSILLVGIAAVRMFSLAAAASCVEDSSVSETQ